MEKIGKKLGRYNKDLSRLGTHKKSEYRKLNERYLNLYFSTKNPAYRDRLIEINLPMVIQIVGKYFNSALDTEDIRDLIQEGNISLIKYIDCYIKNEKYFEINNTGMFTKYMYLTVQDSILSYFTSKMRLEISDETPISSLLNKSSDEDLENNILSRVDDRINKKIIERIILNKNSRDYDILSTYMANAVGIEGNISFAKDLSLSYKISTAAINAAFHRSLKKVQNAVKNGVIEKEQLGVLLQ